MKLKAFSIIEILVILAIIAIMGGLFIGAASRRGGQPSGPAMKYSTPAGLPTIWKITIEGHDYLGFDVYEGAGGLCHAESCQCRK